ncbi:MAG: hypothetical protein Q9M25_05210, partial [Mariprofundaceae bacterium]|nr:hypothetical protein [Mariprofundaceae bacterium]
MSTPVSRLPSHTTDAHAHLNDIPGGIFARLLLQEGLIDERELDKACRVQKRLGADKLLSSILLDLNLISDDDHRRILRKHGRKFRFGDLQCEMGHITLQQLQQAEVAMKRKCGKRIGEILLEMEFINERELAQALSDQLALPLMHIDLDMVNLQLVKKFNTSFLKKNNIIPYDEGENRVAVITSDPLNDNAIREIETRTDKKVDVAIGVQSVIETLINRIAQGAGSCAPGENHDSVLDVV